MLSIIIPSYNHNQIVGRAITSALNQSVPPELIEIIVVDDGTNPPIENIISSMYRIYNYNG